MKKKLSVLFCALILSGMISAADIVVNCGDGSYVNAHVTYEDGNEDVSMEDMDEVALYLIEAYC
jgi:hypothetical protein